MKVGKLTLEQKGTIQGEMVAPDWYFYPIQDGTPEQNWVISTEEMEASEFPEFDWVKTLPLIDWVQPLSPSGQTENYYNQFFG
jgi:hypothetical protein